MRTMTQRALLLLFLPLLAFTSRLSAQNATYELTVDYTIMGFGTTASCGSGYEIYAIMQNGSTNLITSGSLDGLNDGEVWPFPPQTITFTSDNPVTRIAVWSKRKNSRCNTLAAGQRDYVLPAGNISWFDVNVGDLFTGYNVQSNMHITIKPASITTAIPSNGDVINRTSSTPHNSSKTLR
ncbi:hypothetical protein L3C95_11160 [Chitinophaga filiformis]|uniref:hypothetical protein n=1 Tax=Chitinophaga filiformis TaxID=104663 RepID=UPI001F4589D3|nr:hypothetical protein [Chitinophaga filiformis]MCF6402644.1 hypothetical protein [Chitinophaga filiformis]MCF6403438.1 hypothetical protein [Chitinophaga filiformis]